jgi:hypothetical protein
LRVFSPAIAIFLIFLKFLIQFIRRSQQFLLGLLEVVFGQGRELRFRRSGSGGQRRVWRSNIGIKIERKTTYEKTRSQKTSSATTIHRITPSDEIGPAVAWVGRLPAAIIFVPAAAIQSEEMVTSLRPQPDNQKR